LPAIGKNNQGPKVKIEVEGSEEKEEKISSLPSYFIALLRDH